MIGRADRLAWMLAASVAVLVHGALAFAATLLPPPAAPPPVAVEIEMIDLGGGIAAQPSPAPALISGLTPRTVTAAQQPLAAEQAVVSATQQQPIQPVLAGTSVQQSERLQAVPASPQAGVAPSVTMPAAPAIAATVTGVTAPSSAALAATDIVAITTTVGPSPTTPTTVAPTPALTGPLPATPVAPAATPLNPTVTTATPSTSTLSSAPVATTTANAVPANAVAAVTPTTMPPAQPGVVAPPSQPIAPIQAVPDTPTRSDIASLPEQPAVVPLPVPTRGDLVQLIETFAGDDCFSAVPVQSADNNFAIESLAIAPGDNDRLRDAVLEAFGDQVPFQGSTISPEQCRALSFLDRSPGAVGKTVHLGLDNRTVASGSTLTGMLDGTAGRVVHLLIVDDEGRIQAANAYIEDVGPDSRFEIPVVVTGSGASKSQILFAAVADQILQTAAEAQDVPADKFFDALEFELVVKGLEADLSVASFTVE